MGNLCRFLSGFDNAKFCWRVGDVLNYGCVLYGNPVTVMNEYERMVGQAGILPEIGNRHIALADEEQRNDLQSSYF